MARVAETYECTTIEGQTQVFIPAERRAGSIPVPCSIKINKMKTLKISNQEWPILVCWRMLIQFDYLFCRTNNCIN